MLLNAELNYTSNIANNEVRLILTYVFNLFIKENRKLHKVYKNAKFKKFHGNSYQVVSINIEDEHKI